MRAVVTGGAGFIGSHVAEALLAAGHQVWVIDDFSTGLRANVPDGATLVEFDLQQPGLAAWLHEIHPEAVIHCAAQVSVGHSVHDPAADAQRNITATVRLLAAARETGVQTLVYTSSAAVYGNPVVLPIREDHPTTPLSPYGLSKLTGESYVRLLAGASGLRWLVLRYANVYGPRQPASGDGAVVPAFLGAMAAGTEPVIQGDGEQTRDFVFVGDVAAANVQALAVPDITGTFNISSGTRISIIELWRLAAELTGWRRSPRFGPARAGDIRSSVLSAAAAQSALRWSAGTDLAFGLEQTAAFLRSRSVRPGSRSGEAAS